MSLSVSAQDFDPVHPDYNLLKQLVLEKINNKRARKVKSVLKNNEALQLTSDNYTQTLRATKFESNTNNKIRINKKIKKACKYNGYRNAYVDYHITSINCVNFKGNKFYLDKQDTETNTHLFIGNRPTKKEKADEKFKANPVKLYTYQELADLIAKEFISDEGTFKILNNGFDKFGFSLAVEQRTLFRSKIPKIKAIIIVGGNRITW
ncbi:MAG: hypothetical protein JNM51_15795 [Bacteroidia bacterium]|nr:hypothetical protein [Bacteroidia bacterium]